MTQTTLNPVVRQLIEQAKTINKFSIYLIYLAIFAFLLFGTLKSLPSFHQNQTIYLCFHYLPYVLIGFSIPLSCYVAFILWRYRLSQSSMLALCLVVGFGLFFISSYVAFSAWIGVAFLFQANLKRFFKFLNEQSASEHHE